jgi:MFS family permease
VTPRRDLLLLCASAALTGLGTTILALLTPLVALREGAGPAAVGALTAAGFALPLLLAAPAGAWVDRFGARRLLRGGMAAFVIASLPLIALPFAWWTLIAAFVAANAAQLFIVVASQALLAALAGAGRGRDAAYGYWTTSIAVGQVIGPLAGGFALDAFGATAAFAVMGAAFAAGFVVTLPIVERGRAAGPAVPLDLATAKRLLGDRAIALAMLTSSGALWAATVLLTFMPVLLELRGVAATTIGALLSLRAVAAVAVRPFTPRLVTLFGGRERTVVLTLLAIAVGLVGVAVTAQPALLALVMLTFGFGFGLSQPVSMVMVADRAAAGERGAAFGLRLMGNRAAQLLAPIALTVVAQRAGLPLFFVAHALVVLAATLALGLAGRRAP